MPVGRLLAVIGQRGVRGLTVPCELRQCLPLRPLSAAVTNRTIQGWSMGGWSLGHANRCTLHSRCLLGKPAPDSGSLRATGPSTAGNSGQTVGGGGIATAAGPSRSRWLEFVAARQAHPHRPGREESSSRSRAGCSIQCLSPTVAASTTLLAPLRGPTEIPRRLGHL